MTFLGTDKEVIFVETDKIHLDIILLGNDVVHLEAILIGTAVRFCFAYNTIVSCIRGKQQA